MIYSDGIRAGFSMTFELASALSLQKGKTKSSAATPVVGSLPGACSVGITTSP